MLDKQDFKDIARIYNQSLFKKQIIVRGIFHIVLFLFYPLVSLRLPNYMAISIVVATMSLLGCFALIILEKKEIFIPREYFYKNMLRIISLIIVYGIGIINRGFTILQVCSCSCVIIAVEVYSCYKEYRDFDYKMKVMIHS